MRAGRGPDPEPARHASLTSEPMLVTVGATWAAR